MDGSCDSSGFAHAYTHAHALGDQDEGGHDDQGLGVCVWALGVVRVLGITLL